MTGRRSTERRDRLDVAGFVATLLLLWTQVFAVVAPASLVWCVRDDGCAAIEFAGSDCCGVGRGDAAECDEPADDDAASVVAGCHCRDVPTNSDQVLARRATTTPADPDAARAAPSVAAWSLVGPQFHSPAILRGSARPTPPEAVPRSPRALVLRC
jgi:hypothetical protein